MKNATHWANDAEFSTINNHLKEILERINHHERNEDPEHVINTHKGEYKHIEGILIRRSLEDSGYFETPVFNGRARGDRTRISCKRDLDTFPLKYVIIKTIYNDAGSSSRKIHKGTTLEGAYDLMSKWSNIARKDGVTKFVLQAEDLEEGTYFYKSGEIYRVNHIINGGSSRIGVEVLNFTTGENYPIRDTMLEEWTDEHILLTGKYIPELTWPQYKDFSKLLSELNQWQTELELRELLAAYMMPVAF